MKGAIYTLEAVIAIAIIFFAVVVIFRNSSPSLQFQALNYRVKIYDGLKMLEESGKLRKHVVDDDTDSIKSELSRHIPGFLSYEVVLFNETSNVTNFHQTIKDQSNVIAVSYIIAGDVDEYEPREVKVFAWGFD